MTQQPITTRAQSDRGARGLTRPPSPVRPTADRQSRRFEVVCSSLPVQFEIMSSSGELFSVAMGAEATRQTLRGIGLGTLLMVVLRCAQQRVDLSTEAQRHALPTSAKYISSGSGMPGVGSLSEAGSTYRPHCESPARAHSAS